MNILKINTTYNYYNYAISCLRKTSSTTFIWQYLTQKDLSSDSAKLSIMYASLVANVTNSMTSIEKSNDLKITFAFIETSISYSVRTVVNIQMKKWHLILQIYFVRIIFVSRAQTNSDNMIY